MDLPAPAHPPVRPPIWSGGVIPGLPITYGHIPSVGGPSQPRRVDEETYWPEIKDLSGTPNLQQSQPPAGGSAGDYEPGDINDERYWECKDLGEDRSPELKELVREPGQLIWRGRPFFNMNAGGRCELRGLAAAWTSSKTDV